MSPADGPAAQPGPIGTGNRPGLASLAFATYARDGPTHAGHVRSLVDSDGTAASLT